MFIGIAGFIGAMFRFVIKSISFYNFKVIIPINTVIVNIVGCFILAFLSTLTLKTIEKNEDLRIAICTGFLGAFTTFSTLCKDAVTLIYKGEYIYAVIYIFISFTLGFMAIYSGYCLALKVEDKNSKKI